VISIWLLLALATFVEISWWWRRSVKKGLWEAEGLELLPKRPDSLVSGPEQNPEPATLRFSEQEFQEIVSKVLDELPEEFDKEWENVAVIVSTEWPTDEEKKKMGVPEGHVVFGTYSGIARTEGLRSHSSSRHVIVLYQPALELRCGSDKARLEHEIRRVVLHELAHHLGISHQRMKEIGL
jgi:predicted Zn-dependent protease with MMP-like domain